VLEPAANGFCKKLPDKKTANRPYSFSAFRELMALVGSGSDLKYAAQDL
jgi:hypothetical protein